MKINRVISLLLIAIVLVPGCDILQQMVTFTKCEFKMNTLTNTRLASISVQNKDSFKDLSFMDAANVTKTLLGGTLPLSFDLNIEAKNPNATAASMQKMEWRAFIDDIEIAAGVMDQRVAIAPGGTQTIPLKVSVDLKKVINNKTKDALLNFGFNLADAGNYPTRVKLDIKPTIYVGSFALAYPGYFTLKKDFGAN
ncbi:MAG: LEA type 2 family protein [Bacteroidales bacterium]|nr:LEA type 2 family protein [Bacteroidales bacterium]